MDALRSASIPATRGSKPRQKGPNAKHLRPFACLTEERPTRHCAYSSARIALATLSRAVGRRDRFACQRGWLNAMYRACPFDKGGGRMICAGGLRSPHDRQSPATLRSGTPLTRGRNTVTGRRHVPSSPRIPPTTSCLRLPRRLVRFVGHRPGHVFRPHRGEFPVLPLRNQIQRA